jgi:8-oxo-(d)GTP phosphatase
LIKIFVNNIPIVLGSEQEVIKESQLLDLSITHQSSLTLTKIAELLTNRKNIKGIGLCVHDAEKVLKIFSQDYVRIEAAGGIVKNTHNQLLFIYRNGKWDLPKGKMDPGESAEQAALREVQEETGVTALSIQRKLIDTWHTYMEGKTKVLKQTHWFEMICLENQVLVPQKNEGITRAEWLNGSNIGAALENSYGTLQDLFRRCF